MKSFRRILVLLFIAVSCDEPETLVTNIINKDGTVLRRIEMRNIKNDFNTDKLPVPFDSTWLVKDTIEISEKGDTTWIKTTEKLFADPNDINLLYLNDKGPNKSVSRRMSVTKKFWWFHTTYRFSEKIDKLLQYGYPLKDYLNEEELQFFYYPQSLADERLNGPDSLRYKALNDTISKKTEKWLYHSLVSQWIGRFGQLAMEKGGDKVAKEVRLKEKEIIQLYDQNAENFDSLVESGSLLRMVIGEENAMKFKAEADSSLLLAAEDFWPGFSGYSLQAKMPGKLSNTNGFPEDSKKLLWPIRSELFMTQDYEMWAESKVQNILAWIMTGLLFIFVTAGLVYKVIKKG